MSNDHEETTDSFNWKTYFNPFVVICVGLGSLLVSRYFFSKKIDAILNPIKYSTESKVLLKDSKLFKTKQGFYVVGKVENNEIFSWDNVEILISFYNKNKELSYVNTATVKDLRPGESRAYQIESLCTTIEYDPTEYATYEVEIASAESRVK